MKVRKFSIERDRTFGLRQHDEIATRVVKLRRKYQLRPETAAVDCSKLVALTLPFGAVIPAT